jgi:hypothetical protein
MTAEITNSKKTNYWLDSTAVVSHNMIQNCNKYDRPTKMVPTKYV